MSIYPDNMRHEYLDGDSRAQEKANLYEAAREALLAARNALAPLDEFEDLASEIDAAANYIRKHRLNEVDYGI